jgi:hypothetical protein
MIGISLAGSVGEGSGANVASLAGSLMTAEGSVGEGAGSTVASLADALMTTEGVGSGTVSRLGVAATCGFDDFVKTTTSYGAFVNV